MAETTIDLKMYLSGTSAVEQGLGKLYLNLQKAQEQTEKFDKHLKQSAETLTAAFETVAAQLEKTGLEGVANGAAAVSKVVEQTAASVRALNGVFTVMAGQSLVSVFLGLQQLTVHYGAGATASYVLGTATTSLTSALQVFAGVAAIAGAAFVGWQIGKAINDMELLGVKIGDFVAFQILRVMELWEGLKYSLFMTSSEEYRGKMEVLEKSKLEIAGASKQKGQEQTESPEDLARRQAAQAEQLARTQMEAAQRFRTAVLQKDQAVLENLYQQDKIRFDEYVRGKREITLRETNDTLATLNKRAEELKKEMAPLLQRKEQGDATAEAPLAKLEQEAARVKGELAALKEEKDRKQAELDTWEFQQRKSRQQQSEAEQKKKEDTVKRKQDLEQKALDDLKKEAQKATADKLKLLDIEQSERRKQLAEEIKDKQMLAEALVQLDKIYAEKRKKLLAEMAAEEARLDIEKINKKASTDNEALEDKKRKIQNDFRLTNKQKLEQELELLKETLRVNTELTEQMEQQAKAAREKGHEAAAKQFDAQAEKFRGRAKGARGSLRDKKDQPDPNSLRDQMTEVFVEMQNQMQTLAENIATMFKDIVNTAIDATAESIEGLIKGTMTWSQALQNIGDSILNTIISSFAKMAAQWIVNQILMWTVGKALGAASVAATAPMASASAAMWAGPALLSSVASYGAAVGAGQAALTAGLTANQASVKAFSATSGVMAAEGGLITGPGTGTSDSIPALLSNGEFVIPAKKVAEFGSGFFEGIRNGAVNALDLGVGAGGGRAAIPSVNLAATAPKVNVQSAQPKVIVVNSQEELMRVMKGSVGEEITVAHIAKNKLRLGMAS